MITIDDELLKRSLLNATLNGLQSHYISDCPFCGKSQHLYVQRKTSRTTRGGKNASYYWQCKKCDSGGGIFKLLKKLDKLHIISNQREVNILDTFVKKSLFEQEVQVQQHNPPRPLGWKSIKHHSYLNNRGFEPWQYLLYSAGTTVIDPSLRKYIVFKVINNSEYNGYVARLFTEDDQLLRYKNSKLTDFSTLLFGLDEINCNTDTVIIVEGLFDKAAVDRVLELYIEDDVKCVACFGKKISIVQINAILNKGVRNIVVLYDNDAVEATKKYSNELSAHFDSVRVGWVEYGDPGDISSIDQMSHILDNLYDPVEFSLSKVSIKQL